MLAAAGWRYSTNPVPALGGTLDITPAVIYAPRVVAPSTPLASFVSDSLFGLSGKLRVRFLNQSLSAAFPQIARALDRGPGIYTTQYDSTQKSFAFVSLFPFAMKRGDKMGSYRMGFWPAELRLVAPRGYENPDGFIEVTRENQDLYVSEHFRLRDFVTHDQNDVWPKYVALREELLDKLELVIADLTVRGIAASNVVVMSGFRTPHHNQYGIGEDGGARDSRHQFGDAADIIIDSNHDGRMDDLNFDGRVNTRDAEELLHAVDRVERLYPDLVGGVGTYAAMGPHGPFAHIDVRGYRARWGGDVIAKRRTAARPARAEVATEGTCRATGASAVLCAVRSAKRY
jgi:uncharacterized protein YcbK (DUF882 family)